MYVYCNFYCSPAKKHGSDPPLFWGWRRHCFRFCLKCAKFVGGWRSTPDRPHWSSYNSALPENIADLKYFIAPKPSILFSNAKKLVGGWGYPEWGPIIL